MKIIIVDDHAVVRMGLRAVLESVAGASVVADFARAEDAINWLRAHSVDLVVMDLRFRQDENAMDGITAVRKIREMDGPPVLVVTTYGSEPEILGALAAGAAGYVLKDADTAELQRAVVAAASGEQFLGTGVEAQIHQGGVELTNREMDVLRLVAQGKTNAGVAEALFLSAATVKTHLNRIFDKLGVNSRTAAVATARSLGLLEE
ncbi:MAG: response regulator transcription factor [Gleimia sp.]|nr:response regulator transcription factor [Acidobacteriota bacterium]